jgi:spore germination protein KC
MTEKQNIGTNVIRKGSDFMKKLLFIIFIVLQVFLLTSCWNNRDLTDLAIVVGVAIDKTEDNRIEITVQIVKPQEMKPGGEGGSKESKAYTNISSQGVTIFDAIRNLLAKLNKKAYFAQVQLVVISEEAAREGISNYFDFFERDTETRRRAELLIAKGMKARTVLDSESRLANTPTTHNVEALEASQAFGKSLSVKLIDVLKIINQQRYDIVLPILYNSKQTEDVYQEDLIYEGSAVIKKDKLIGFFDPYQTRGYLFAKDEIKSTIINVPSPIDDGDIVSIEIIRSKGKSEAKMQNGKPVLSIEVKAEGNIGEQQAKADLTKPDTIKALENEVQKAIKKEIADCITISQQEYHSDVFGFIDDIYINYYSDWKNIKSNWREMYSTTKVDINVKFEIKRAGLIKNPVEPK